MSKVGQPYTSGSWIVSDGNEGPFVERWTAFVDWTSRNCQGAGMFILIRDAQEARRFLSLGSWDSLEDVDAWRSRPEFAELLGACRALCDDFQGRDYTLSAAVPA